MKKLFYTMLLLATILTITACGSDDKPDNAKLSITSYTMYHEDLASIEGTDISDLTWKSENEFVATVKDDEITAQYVGKTTVKSATKGLSFTVEVKPRYHTYEEPFLDWGASISEIKAKYGAPESEDANSLLYKTDNSNAPLLLYIFENGKLYTCGVACKVSVASQLADFLLERYVPVQVDVDNYKATFLHCYGTFSDPQTDYGVAMQYRSSIGGILVVYTGLNTKTKTTTDNDFSNSFEKLTKALTGVQL